MTGTTSPERTRTHGSGTERLVDHDESRGTYHARCDETDREPASTAVVLAVSSVTGADPTDLEPLHASVDPDALNALYRHWSGRSIRDGSVSFTFSNCDVTVYGTGEIVVDPLHPDASA